MTEVSGGGKESRIFLDMSTAAKLRDCLSDFSHFCASLESIDSERRSAFDNLKSERILKDESRYYFDLKENERGRFIRISHTKTWGGTRHNISIPAEGMINLRDALIELLHEFGTDDLEKQNELESRITKMDYKPFYGYMPKQERWEYPHRRG